MERVSAKGQMIKLLVFLSCIATSCTSLESNTDSPETTEQANTFSGRIVLGEKHAREQVRKAASEQVKILAQDTLIKNSKTAISIAESILFDIYGEEQIIEERPYEVYLIDGYWYITGTLPVESKGGTFEIIIDSKNGKIIRLIHYK